MFDEKFLNVAADFAADYMNAGDTYADAALPSNYPDWREYFKAHCSGWFVSSGDAGTAVTAGFNVDEQVVIVTLEVDYEGGINQAESVSVLRTHLTVMWT